MPRTLSNFPKASHDPVAVGTAVSLASRINACIHGVSTVKGCIQQQLGRGRPPTGRRAVLPHAATSHMRMLPQSSGATRAGAKKPVDGSRTAKKITSAKIPVFSTLDHTVHVSVVTRKTRLIRQETRATIIVTMLVTRQKVMRAGLTVSYTKLRSNYG
jgi:hypothetical protein